MMRHSTPKRFLLVTVRISMAFWLIMNSALFADEPHDEIPIHNLLKLSAQPSPCHRIALGEPDDYKPCIARLPSEGLYVVEPDGRCSCSYNPEPYKGQGWVEYDDLLARRFRERHFLDENELSGIFKAANERSLWRDLQSGLVSTDRWKVNRDGS